jgi:hypothetical protein
MVGRSAAGGGAGKDGDARFGVPMVAGSQAMRAWGPVALSLQK